MIRFKTDDFAWAIAACTIFGLSGCKHISVTSPVAPMVAPPAAVDGYSPGDNGYFHQAEPGPGLSPVPNLPAPGHSIPTDPPPPAPAPPDDSTVSNKTPGESVAASKAPWVLRPMSFLNRKESKTDVQSAATQTETARATPQPVLATTPQPALLPTPDISRWSPGRRELILPRQSTVAASTSQTLNPPATADSYAAPVITPGSQYTAGRNAPIENWPPAKPRTVEQPVVRLRKQPAPVTSELFVPVTPSKSEAVPSSIQPEPSSATVPLLLPPGA